MIKYPCDECQFKNNESMCKPLLCDKYNKFIENEMQKGYEYKLTGIDKLIGKDNTKSEAVEDYLKQINEAVYQDCYKQKEKELFGE